jgi:hypothetical protein
MCYCYQDWYDGPIPCPTCQMMDAMSKERDKGFVVITILEPEKEQANDTGEDQEGS